MRAGKCAAIFLCLCLAATCASARELQQSRELQQLDLSKLDLSKLPSLPALGLLPQGVELPPLKDFLPPLDSINLPPLNEFLTSVGLPTWEQMNLPPLSEFMKPVFDPKAVELPSLADVLQQANTTFQATVKEIMGGIPLPPGMKLPTLKLPPALANVDLSKITLPAIDPANMPKMPSLEQVLNFVNTIQSGQLPEIKNLDKLIPPELLKSLPPVQDVMKSLAPLLELANKLPKDLSKLDLGALLNGGGQLNLPALAKVLGQLPAVQGLDKLPPLQDIVKTVTNVAQLVGKAGGAPAAAAGRRLLQEM